MYVRRHNREKIVEKIIIYREKDIGLYSCIYFLLVSQEVANNKYVIGAIS